MNQYSLELTITHKSGRVEYDFRTGTGKTREEAIAKQSKILAKCMEPIPGGYPNSFSKWESFTLK